LRFDEGGARSGALRAYGAGKSIVLARQDEARKVIMPAAHR
jgi:hypothetical protein